MKADFNFHCQLINSIKIDDCIKKFKTAKESTKNILDGFLGE
jgi:hypothetical protein